MEGISRRRVLRVAASGAGLAALGGATGIGQVLAAGGKAKLDPPTLAETSSTRTTITLSVCAGPSGAPSGFSLQWMTAAALAAAGGWPASDDLSLCKAGFAGHPPASGYSLAPAECTSVTVGALSGNGVTTTCPGDLACGTEYVFRAFALATKTTAKSNYTPDLVGSTASCDPGCTFTQGYWATHNPVICDTDPTSPFCTAWPVSSLLLGTVTYTDAQLVSILETPINSNGLIALAHQLIATKLNVANGADPTAIASTIVAADALIGNLVVPPVGSDVLTLAAVVDLVAALVDYNTGVTGPGHCA
jgi:hypothetical protein